MNWIIGPLDFVFSFYVFYVLLSPVALISVLFFIGYAVVGCLRGRTGVKQRRDGAIGTLASCVLFCMLTLPAYLNSQDIKGRTKSSPVTVSAPDGISRVEYQLYFTFPTSEWLDPRMYIEVRLFEDSGKLLNKTGKAISELSNVTEPEILWSHTEVVVRGFDNGNGEIRMKRKAANQALQTTPVTRSVYEKTTEFGHPQRGV